MFELQTITATFDADNLYLTVGSDTVTFPWAVLKYNVTHRGFDFLMWNIASQLVISNVDLTDKNAIAAFINSRQFRA